MEDYDVSAATSAEGAETSTAGSTGKPDSRTARGSRRGGHGMLMGLCMAAMMGAAWFLVGGGSDGGTLGYGWILFVLACPLMHLFMGHGGHGSHGNDSGEGSNKVEKD